MENSTMTEEEREREIQLMKNEPKTLSKKELEVLREAAKILFNIKEAHEEPKTKLVIKGESNGESGATSNSGR